jgi:CheY-like chemotaxis protein
VLLVDDEEPMRLLLARFIGEDLKAEISLAGTCESALRFASESTYDVILLDLLMPGIGGFEVLKRIRTDSMNKATPVVVVSVLVASLAGDESASVERAQTLGADAFVSKPVKRKALLAAIKAQLGNGTRRKENRGLRTLSESDSGSSD